MDMSFVGPRPERPHFVAELQKRIPYYAQRLAVKPGITGWAQVRYGYGATIDDAIEKLQYDLYYIKNMSVFLYFFIMLSTVHKVLFAKVAMQTDREAAPEVSTSQADSELQNCTAGTGPRSPPLGRQPRTSPSDDLRSPKLLEPPRRSPSDS